MLEIAVAQDLEETLSDVEASIGDLISAKEFDSMAAITFEFGESLITVQDIDDMVLVGFFKEGRAIVPPTGQTVPALAPEHAVVFKDFFTCSLRMPAYGFLRQVMEAFNVELQHFSPNGVLTLSKFSWAYEFYGGCPILILSAPTLSFNVSRRRSRMPKERSFWRSSEVVRSCLAGRCLVIAVRSHTTRRINGRRIG